MDLFAILRSKIGNLPRGEYSTGLRAVLRHLETSFRHLSRGQLDGDETAFTDVIYRTNQAFEGSIKEAYRVLAQQDPGGKKPSKLKTSSRAITFSENGFRRSSHVIVKNGEIHLHTITTSILMNTRPYLRLFLSLHCLHANR